MSKSSACAARSPYRCQTADCGSSWRVAKEVEHGIDGERTDLEALKAQRRRLLALGYQGTALAPEDAGHDVVARLQTGPYIEEQVVVELDCLSGRPAC